MKKDPRAQFPTVTSQLKLQVTPDRAAVFVDDGFVGTVREFSGLGERCWSALGNIGSRSL